MAVLFEFLVEWGMVKHFKVKTKNIEQPLHSAREEWDISCGRFKTLSKIMDLAWVIVVEEQEEIEQLNCIQDLPHALH